MAPTQEHVVLGFSEGTSDKQYKIVWSKNDDGTFSVVALFGPRGRLRQQSNIALNVPAEEASVQADKMMRAKMKKGYRLEAKSPNWDITMSSARAPAVKPSSTKLSAAEKALAKTQTPWF